MIITDYIDYTDCTDFELGKERRFPPLTPSGSPDGNPKNPPAEDFWGELYNDKIFFQ
jgi:hypothetical protein